MCATLCKRWHCYTQRWKIAGLAAANFPRNHSSQFLAGLCSQHTTNWVRTLNYHSLKIHWLKTTFRVPSYEFCRRCQLMPCFFIANHPSVLSFPPQLPPSVEVGWTCRQLRGQAWAEGLSRGRWRW